MINYETKYDQNFQSKFILCSKWYQIGALWANHLGDQHPITPETPQNISVMASQLGWEIIKLLLQVGTTQLVH